MFRMCRAVLATTVFVLVAPLGLGVWGCSSPKEAQREPAPGAEKYVEDARAELDSKHYTEARALLELAHQEGASVDEINSVAARLERELGQLAVDEGDVAKAYEHFSKAAELEDDPDKRFDDLIAAIEAGRQAGLMAGELAPLASDAVELETSSKRAQTLAAQLWDDAGEPGRALPHYAWLHKVTPEDTSITLRLATLYIADEKLRDAQHLLEKVYADDSQNVVAALKLADVYARIGEHDQARTLYERLIKAYPKRASIMMRYARYLQSRGETERAEKMREKAREAQPQRERRKMRELR